MIIRRFRKTVDAVLGSLPPELLRQLNGGILVRPETKEDGETLILGEYIEDPDLSSLVLLYYGSFAEALEGASPEEWEEEIEETVIHELRHHVESLAGVDYLAREEEMEYLQDADGEDEDV
ncbi:MAG: metallopeptidase family protein [Aminivibrio sp.]|nr:metallopeptidase family protein [Aminivibrio sp.]